jgi:HEAT repeat protein
LRELLRDGDLLVREASIRALGLIGPEASAAVADLMKQLEDEDERIRLAALDALQGIGAPPTALPVLAAHRAAFSPAERAATVRVIGKLSPTPGQVSALTKALNDCHVHVRYWAAEALGRLGVKGLPAWPDLWDLQQREPSAMVRFRVGTAIARIAVAELRDFARMAVAKLDDINHIWGPIRLLASPLVRLGR